MLLSKFTNPPLLLGTQIGVDFLKAVPRPPPKNKDFNGMLMIYVV
jgi:hypothetical protein